MKNVSVESCYICEGFEFKKRNGAVRDAPHLHILECRACGLVFLSDKSHISGSHYADSNMHGENMPSIIDWLRVTRKDDGRRFKSLEESILGRNVLDFGAGAGGFVELANGIASQCFGVELETRILKYWKNKLNIFSSVGDLPDDIKFDVITAFHVVEHLPDPRSVIVELAERLSENGVLVIEVPNANDALLTLFECDEFQNFTYWSQHLYLFNAHTISILAEQCGLRTKAITHVQRYPLSNHLHWLARGLPGGHSNWGFLDTEQLNHAYEGSLSRMGMTDTLLCYLQR